VGLNFVFQIPKPYNFEFLHSFSNSRIFGPSSNIKSRQYSIPRFECSHKISKIGYHFKRFEKSYFGSSLNTKSKHYFIPRFQCSSKMSKIGYHFKRFGKSYFWPSLNSKSRHYFISRIQCSHKMSKIGITSRDLKFFISSRHDFMKNMSISFVWENLFGTSFFFVSCVLFSSRLLVLIKIWPNRLNLGYFINNSMDNNMFYFCWNKF